MTNLDSEVYDLLGIIEDRPVTATWNGLDYEGTSGGLVTTKKLEPGGFLADYDLQWATSLWKRKAPGLNELIERFPDANASLPEDGDTLTIGGVAYRIDKVTGDQLTAGLTFDLVNVAKMN